MLNLFSRCLGSVLQFLTCIIKKRCSVRLAWTYTYCLCSLAACEQELLLNVRPPSSRRLLRLIHLPFLLWYRRKSQAVIMICPEEKEADEEDEDDDAVEEDIAADENLFFFFSS